MTHLAARNGALHCIQWLIDELGQDPLRLDRNGMTVLKSTSDGKSPGALATAQWLRQRKFPSQRYNRK